MASNWILGKHILPVFAVCLVFCVVVESHIVQPKEEYETEIMSREKQNPDLEDHLKPLSNLKSHSIQENKVPEIILFDTQTAQRRIKRTASAVTLAAARRLEEERRRKLGIATKRYYPSARRVGTAVRLAAARRGLRVGQRRKTVRNWKWDERKKTREEAEIEREEEGTTESPQTGSDENKLTEEENRQKEVRRQEVERRKEEEREKASTIPEKDRRNDEEEWRKAEQKRQLEERQRQLAERQEAERQRQIKERRRLLEELRKLGGGGITRGAGDEERRRILEELRRLGTWEENDHRPNKVETTPAPVTARPAHDLRHRCRDCVVGGKSFQGHSRFVYEEGCDKFNCICRCDGTHECPDSHKINICDERERDPPGKQVGPQPKKEPEPQPKNPIGICRTCDAKGQIIEGNNYFDLQEDCTLYRNCRCYCNGTWACAEDKAETICVRKDVDSDSRGPQNHLQVEVGGCNKCHIQGRHYKGNSTFQLRNVCIGTTCKCLCNGTVDCDPDSTVNICLEGEMSTVAPNLEIVISRNQKIYPLKCKQCNVHGNIVEGSSKFNLKWECYLDTCFCDCEGRYSCVRHLGENLCEGQSLEPKGDKVCHGCYTDERTYPGGSQFQYKQGCDAMDCTCSCSGTLECDDTTYVNICETTEPPLDPANEIFVPGYGHGSNPSACSNCLVNGSTIHGNSYFERKEGCYVEQCHCQCDGRLNCRRIPGQEDGMCEESTVESKPAQVLCRRCSFLGTDYPGNSTFPYNNGCSLTLCKCSCNGTAACDYSTTVNICEDNTTPEPVATTTGRPGTCKACEVEGKEFAGGAEFELKRGCKAYPCHCNCNGRWGCDINEAKDVCGKDPVSRPSVVSTGCQECELDGFYYAGESRFQFTNSCVTINCKCECNGSVQCDYTSTVNNCVTRITNAATLNPEEPTSAPSVEDGCKRCTADGKTYKGNSNFELKRGCMVYPCECNCNGQWGCQTHKAKDVCNKDAELKTDSCQRCTVEGKEYDGNVTFYHTHDCVRRACFCACTGSVQCDEDSAENVCEPPNGGNGNNAETYVNLVECHNCQFHGKNYEGNSSIIHKEGCKIKSCKCTCSGAVECDDSTEVDICSITTQLPARRSHKRRKEEKCKQCSVAGSQYEGGSTFKLKRGCLVYACNCLCSGRWFCNTNDPNNVCEETGSDKRSCFPCDVKGRRFAGGSEFKLREGCISHKCTCACDGTWECPPEKSANYCPGSTLPPEFVTENNSVN